MPDRYVSFPGLRLSMGEWEALQIPAGVAFLFQNSALERMAVIYPGPAGATESELALDRWTAMVAANPGLESLEDDVEAVLVRAAPGEEAPECFIVPIDTCYELVGRLRQLWRGVDGGCEARSETEAYFTRVRARAESIAGAPTHGQEQT